MLRRRLLRATKARMVPRVDDRQMRLMGFIRSMSL